MFFKIYKTTNLINGKIYIGQTHYDKPGYLGSGVLISAAVEKYGSENFLKEYIDEALSQEELDEKEKYWIRHLESQNKDIGYNIADGGWNCLTMNDEIKEKISHTLKGKYIGENAFRKGMTLTEEHKKAISRSNKGKTLSEETKRKLSDSNKGKTHSEETRKKMSESRKGKILTIEHREKISEGGKGRVFSDDQKERLRQSNLNKTQLHSRTVFALCIKTNMELNFNNMSEAARWFNTTRHRIKNNMVEDWTFVIGNPAVSIKDLKNTKDGSESTSNARQ